MRLEEKMMKQIRYCLTLRKYLTKLNIAELVCTKTNGTKYNFNTFTLPVKFVKFVNMKLL